MQSTGNGIVKKVFVDVQCLIDGKIGLHQECEMGKEIIPIL